MKRCLSGLLCLLMAGLSAQAAPPTTAPMANAPPRLPLRHLGIVQGLAQSAAQVIGQDRSGYMWLGTQSGLQRYDGYSFVNFHHDPSEPGSLAQNDVTALAAAPDGSIWVGTRSAGLDRLRPGAHAFTHFTHQPGNPQSLAGDIVNSLLIDREARVWVGTQSGLDHVEADGRIRHVRPAAANPGEDGITQLFEDSTGQIWVGSTHGVLLLDTDAATLQPLTVDVAHASDAARLILRGTINAFAQMPDGAIWIGGDNGIVVLSSRMRVLHVFTHNPRDAASLGSNHVRAIVRGRYGAIWVATYGGGLSRMRDPSRGFTTFRHNTADPSSLSADNLYTLFVDHTGLLWIGSLGGGIDIYNPTSRAFESIRAHPGAPTSSMSDLIWAIGADSDGQIWAGTHAGLSRVDTQHASMQPWAPVAPAEGFTRGGPVMNLLGDPQGGLWIATATAFFHRQAGSDTLQRIDLGLAAGSPDSASIRQIFLDARQRLWLGTASGLLRVDPETGAVLERFTAHPGQIDELPRASISSICQSRDGDLWVGTGHGMRRFDADQGRFHRPASKPGASNVLEVSDILSCLPDPDGSLWVGTASGIIHFQPGKGVIRTYNESSGLPSQTIYSLLRDRTGNIWAGTDRGLLRLDPVSGRVRSFGQRDGLENEEFNQTSAYAAPDGSLYFGGVNGISVIHPDQLGQISTDPMVAITGFTLIGRDGEQTSNRMSGDGLTLDYTQNIASFTVAVMDFTDPTTNIFRYRLLGFDDSWHKLRGRHTITFTNLDGGSYTLQVRGSGSSDIFSKHTATLALTVLPPPWQTWWAWLAYACAAIMLSAAGLYLFALWISRKRDLKSEQHRRRLAEAQHELMHEVARLDDPAAIAAQLMQRLPDLIDQDRAVLFAEAGGNLEVLAERGFSDAERHALQQWPAQHAGTMERLRRQGASDPLASMDAQPFQALAPDIVHSIVLPFVGTHAPLHVLVLGRASPPFSSAEHDVADVLVRQISVLLDRAQLLRELEVLATTDSLTQVLNRRSFLEQAESDFKRARRYGEPLCLLMMDLDRFKSINDSFGHQAGDRVLQAVVDACKNSLRDSDSLGRYGGEEFVVCLPQTDTDTARGVAERLRTSVHALRVDTPNATVGVTVSIGVAFALATDASIENMITRADRALYAAKDQGRDRVVVDGTVQLA